MGCTMSSSAGASPLRRKGDLVEADSKPYLPAAAEEKQQYWVDPEELVAEERPKGDGKSSKQNGPKTKKQTENGKAKPDTPKLTNDVQKLSKEDHNENEDEAKHSSTPTDPMDSEISSLIPIIPQNVQCKKRCVPYAAIYDEMNQSTKLVHWNVYEKKYLPGFMVEREIIMKSQKGQIMPDNETEIKKISEEQPLITDTSAKDLEQEVKYTNQETDLKDPTTEVIESIKKFIEEVTDTSAENYMEQEVKHKDEGTDQKGPITEVDESTKKLIDDMTETSTEKDLEEGVKCIDEETDHKDPTVGVLESIQKFIDEINDTSAENNLEQEVKCKDEGTDQKGTIIKVDESTKELIDDIMDTAAEKHFEQEVEHIDGAEQKDPNTAVIESIKKFIDEINDTSAEVPEGKCIDEGTNQNSPTIQVIDDSNEIHTSEMKDSMQPGPHTIVYDAETQYLQLISWDEYVSKYQQEDMLEWKKKTEIKCIPEDTSKMSRLEEKGATEIFDPAKPVTVIYDESSQSVKLIPWELYECAYLPDDLAVRKERELSRFYTNQKIKEKKRSESLTIKPSLEELVCNNLESREQRMKPTVEYTTVYDPVTQGVNLISWNDYLKMHKLPKQDWAVEYDEKSQSIKLVFWKEFINQNELKQTAAPENMPPSGSLVEKTMHSSPSSVSQVEFTTVYDPVTEGVKLISWDEYLKANTPPKQDWALEYDEKTQSVKLVFWKENIYQTEKKLTVTHNNLQASASQVEFTTVYDPVTEGVEFTTVYDPVTEGVKLISWEEYLKANTPPKQDWAVEYDEKNQSVKLVFWKENIYQTEKKPTVVHDNLQASASQVEFTTIYDPVTEGVKLISWEEYLKTNTPPKQDWCLEYDEKTQSVKLEFWKENIYQRKKKETVTHENLEASDFHVELTTVYDPVTEGVKLISWEEYLKENTPPKQDWAVEYDETSQSVKLVFWKEFINQTEGIENAPHKSLVTNNVTVPLTTIFNPETQSVDLINYDEYVRHNKLPKQDYAVIYDELNKSVKLIYWKDYQENFLPNVSQETVCNTSFKESEVMKDGYAAVYDELEQSVKLISWDIYESTYLPNLIHERSKTQCKTNEDLIVFTQESSDW